MIRLAPFSFSARTKSLFGLSLLAAPLFLQGCGGSSTAATCSAASASTTSARLSVTSNAQVAKYTYTAPGAGSVYVQFGTTTGYGRKTSSVTASSGSVSILVAGMLANTTYHMQAVFTADDGTVTTDADQSFTTGGVPCKFTATLTGTTTSGMTPQPGIEMIDGGNNLDLPAPVATDLQGNILWTYAFPDESTGVSAMPIRLLANGDMLMLLMHNSSTLLTNTTGVDTGSEVREINLAGDTVQSLSITELNARLAAKGKTLTLGGFSHDVIQLSNGHFVLDATTEQSVTLTGDTTPTTVLGDVIVDLDTNLQPVWTWNTFDHLDVNRHPFNFPDWTHANAISYDPVDGSLLYSLRHQNWVLKVNYANGSGDGTILWKLGPQGDFSLLATDGSVDNAPEDWFYSQHAAEYISTDESGRITMSLMDNGNDRQFANGTSCPVTAGDTCYSTIPIFQLDESAKTAKFLFHQILSPSLYNEWGGNTNILANGDVQYHLAGLSNSTKSAAYEVTGDSTAKTVWSMQMNNAQAYRGERWPSLYPGVQW
ncbi:MAG: aryl-sulfate sulfotransferase [Acidobacteriaceae bacterium]|nr:aryl-sulfate sulfotransferase [Acidobacteriaceae bacterium]